MRLAFFLPAGLLCVCACLAEPPKPTGKTAFDKPTLEAYLRHRFFWDSRYNIRIEDPKPAPLPGYKEVIIEVSAGQASKQIPFYVSDNGQNVVYGEVFNINKSPFDIDLAKLNTEGQPSYGPPNAPVKIAMFSDFECNFCKEESIVMRDKISKQYPTQVQVFFMDFPLDAIHPWARAAAVDGRCVYHQNPTAFWTYHDWLYDRQGDITNENLRGNALDFASKHGLEILQFTSCIDRRSTEGDVNRTVAQGKALGIDSTPTIFVNGRRLVGKLEWPVMQQVIDDEINYQKKVKASEEACCEVKLPSPLK